MRRAFRRKSGAKKLIAAIAAPQWKLKLGLPMVLALLFSGTTIARLISPSLIGDGFIWNVHLVTLGLAMLSLAMVYLLPLRPVPHAKVIQPLDLVSFGLIATGFGGMTVAFVMGPIHWWDDAVWIGWLLAGCVVCLIVAAVIELHRETPLLDLRWIASPPILHLTGTLMIFRLVLSEQTSGAPRMFQPQVFDAIYGRGDTAPESVPAARPSMAGEPEAALPLHAGALELAQ